MLEKIAKALYSCSQENLLCESQKLIEFDSYNALLNEGTNYHNKQPFIPLSKKKGAAKIRERNPTKPSQKLKVENKKNGRLFQMKDNVVFVDLIGKTAVGNLSKDFSSDAFTKSKYDCIIFIIIILDKTEFNLSV